MWCVVTCAEICSCYVRHEHVYHDKHLEVPMATADERDYGSLGPLAGDINFGSVFYLPRVDRFD